MAKDNTLIWVAAIAGGVVLFYDPIKKLITGVSDVSSGAGTAAQGAGQGISIGFQGIGQGASDAAKGAGTLVYDVGTGLGSPFGLLRDTLNVSAEAQRQQAAERAKNELWREQQRENLKFEAEQETAQFDLENDRRKRELERYEQSLRDTQARNQLTISLSPKSSSATQEAFQKQANDALSKGYTSLADYLRGRATTPQTPQLSGTPSKSLLQKAGDTLANPFTSLALAPATFGLSLIPFATKFLRK